MAIGANALQGLFERVDSLRVGIIGDFCLDAYWHADMRKSELSRETPHFPLPIIRERMQPGGAGNVACNLAALKPGKVTALSVLGSDWRGAILENLLLNDGVETGTLLRADGRVTNAYIKPMRQGITESVYEDPRLDFENHEELPEKWEDALLGALDQAALTLDLLYVCDQMRFGCVTGKVRKRIIELGKAGLTIIVDSRDRIALYSNVIAKPNEVELCRAMGVAVSEDEEVLSACAGKLQDQTRKPLLVTLGSRGCMVLENGGVHPMSLR